MVDLSVVPVYAISENTKQLIGTLLNPPKVIPASNKLCRDWRGFAHVCGISGETTTAISVGGNKFNDILCIISKSKDFTLQSLKEAFEKIERDDIIQDSSSLIEKDAELWLENSERSKQTVEQNDYSQEPEIITFDDVFRFNRGEDNQRYDGFLLYADEDADFAQVIVDNLENKKKLKLCLKDRDLVAGISFEHTAIMKLISERCNRIIVIISPEFLVSSFNKYLLNFAQATGINENKERKVIPCVYKECELPHQLKYFSKLYYGQNPPTFFWEKLANSIIAVTSPSSVYLTLKNDPITTSSNEKLSVRTYDKNPASSEKLSLKDKSKKMTSNEKLSVAAEDEKVASNERLSGKDFCVEEPSKPTKAQKVLQLIQPKNSSYKKVLRKVAQPVSIKKKINKEISILNTLVFS